MRLSKIGYKSLIIAGALMLFALPASAAISYSRTPSGFYIKSPVDIDVSVDSFSDDFGWNIASGCFFEGNQSCNFWGLGIKNFNYEIIEGTCIPISNLNINNNFNLPTGDYIEVLAKTGNTQASCDNGGEQSYLLENNAGETIFTIISAPTLYFLTPTSTAGNLLAAIGDQLADPGFLGWGVLAAGIILGFWALEKFLDLIPKDKEK